MLDSIDRLIRQAMSAAEKVGEKAGEAAWEFGPEALFVTKLLTLPKEQALEALRTKMQRADERTYTVLKLTLTGMMRIAQMAEASGELSPYQTMVLRWISPKYMQTLTMYANYVDELYDGRSTEHAANGTLLAGSEAPSTTSSQIGKPELTSTSAGWLPGITSTRTYEREQQSDAFSPEQIVADFVTRSHARATR